MLCPILSKGCLFPLIKGISVSCLNIDADFLLFGMVIVGKLSYLGNLFPSVNDFDSQNQSGVGVDITLLIISQLKVNMKMNFVIQDY